MTDHFFKFQVQRNSYSRICNQSSSAPSYVVFDESTLFSVLANHFPPSFVDTYNLSKLSLGCFLVFLSICTSSFLVHFKNGPDYFTSGKAMVFIPFIRFPWYCLVSSSFLFLPRCFLNFSFISTFLMVSDSNIPTY